MRPRYLVLAFALVLLTGLLLGCGSKAPPTDTKSDPVSRPGQPPADAQSKDAGSPLYPPVAAPVYATGVARTEPLVISQALVSFDERQVIAAEVDGTIELFASPIKPGEKVDPDQIVYHPRDPMKKHPMKRIVESDEVEDGQVVAFLDEQQVDARIRGSKAIKAAAEVALKHASESAKLSDDRVALLKKGYESGGISNSDVIDGQLQSARFRENESQAVQTIAKTQAELEESTVMLAKHQVKSRVKGVIRSIAKRAGEYVKSGEKIMEIEATDRVRIEGNLDVQHAGAVRRGMTVTVEPAVPSAPIASHTGHRQAVTGVAVTAHPDGPLVVSVGADAGALVWDPNLGKKTNRPTVPHNLPHPVGVRSVVATPPATKAALVITGADDGKIRVWDVSNRDRLPTVPKAEPDDAHGAAVHALAVSPDGRYFASAAGRDVFVWDLVGVKKLYALPAEHRDNITSVCFTPQDTLVTASKDGTLKVWKLGTERAVSVRTLDHRAGAVEALGVSRDGARVLFDQDKGRVDLVDPANGQTIGQIQNISSAGSFSTLALFGPDEVPPGTPDDKLPPYSIATAGGEGDLKGTLQYWLAPRTGGRGAEAGRLITPNRSPVTAAAFSPVRGEPFLVVGTASGGVHLWKPPTEARKAHTGKITFIDATDGRYLTVRVQMDNADLNLLDHSAATIIVPTNP
jgi:WD40 repeat protein/biotin carboxyl carrier protein